MTRLLEVFLASVGLVVLSPLFLVCALMVWRGHDGSIIFRQERVRRYGRPFRICKFRTMRMDAERNGPQLCGGEDDERLTVAGHKGVDAHRPILRKRLSPLPHSSPVM